MAQLIGAPVYGASWPSVNNYPSIDPFWRGSLPTTAKGIAEILSRYDCLLGLGGKSLVSIVYTMRDPIPESIEFYHISEDANDLGYNDAPKLGIFGNVRATLTQPMHRSTAGRQYFHDRGGALGWAMPAAIGVSLAHDHAPVLCIVGDGSAMYAPQALWSAAHEAVPVAFVVLNNLEYGILKSFMLSQPQTRLSEVLPSRQNYDSAEEGGALRVSMSKRPEDRFSSCF